YRTRLTGMTADEAEALFLAGLPGPAAQLGLGTVVAAPQLKVMAALPPELRSRASRLVQRFHLDAAGWFQANEEVPHLATLSTAVWEGRKVAVEYHRGDDVVSRTLEPIGLVLKGGVWYVVAVLEGQAWRLNQVFGRGTVAGGERVEETDHPGTVRLRVRLGYPDEVPGLLLAVGHDVDVLGPPEIREKVVVLANRIADRYRDTALVDAGR